MKATPNQQKLLLKLAALDTEVARLVRQEQQLPQYAQLEQLQVAAKPLRQNLLAAQREAEVLQTELNRLESDLEVVVKRIAHDEGLLAVSSDPKVAQGVTRELAQLAERRENLEAQELEVLEKLETAQQKLDSLSAENQQLSTQQQEINAALQDAQKQLAAELAAAKEKRQGQAAEITGDLLQEYEQIRARVGIGAARLNNGVSEASGMQLTPGELAVVAGLAADDVFYCSQTGVILVRV